MIGAALRVTGAASLLAVASWVLWLLATNPGYFSHDELQWGAFADVERWQSLPWQSLLDVGVYQYRPLTFNLWLLLSHGLFEHPRAMHVVWVLLGLGNAALLAGVVRRFGAGTGVAWAAAVLFALSPYAVYVHGWTATLADLLWLGLALLLARVVLAHDIEPRHRFRLAAVAAALTALALLSKEAAVAIPALLLVAWAATRERRWGWALLGAASVTVVYLLLRAEVVLFQTPAGTGYGWSLARIPLRFAQYHLFAFYPWPFEIETLFNSRPGRVAWMAALVLACHALALRRLRSLLWLALATGAALGPVLILDSASNQYGYGFAAVLAGAPALAWPRCGAWGRGAIVLLALLSTWHGVRVAQDMREVGEIQHRFSPALAEALRVLPADARLMLYPECGADRWIYVRLTHDIPRYARVAVGERVEVVEGRHPGAVPIACDGSLSTSASPHRESVSNGELTTHGAGAMRSRTDTARRADVHANRTGWNPGDRPTFVAHAGGLVYGRDYTNSKEALDTNYAAGFRAFEIDLNWTSDGELVLIHDWDRAWKRYFGGGDVPDVATFRSASMAHGLTPMDFAGLHAWLERHPDAIVITDVKTRNADALARLATLPLARSGRIVPQAYDFKEFHTARALGFPRVVLTVYRMNESAETLMRFVREHRPWALTVPRYRAERGDFDALLDSDAFLYVHTVDDPVRWHALRSAGVDGIYTGRIAPD